MLTLVEQDALRLYRQAEEDKKLLQDRLKEMQERLEELQEEIQGNNQSKGELAMEQREDAQLFARKAEEATRLAERCNRQLTDMRVPIFLLFEGLKKADEDLTQIRRDSEQLVLDAACRSEEAAERMRMWEEAASSSLAEAEKLREQARGDSKLLEEAADEIERLAARLQEEERRGLCAGERSVFLQDELREVKKRMNLTCRKLKEELLLDLEDIRTMAAALEQGYRGDETNVTQKQERNCSDSKNTDGKRSIHETIGKDESATDTAMAKSCYDAVRRCMPEMKTLCDQISHAADTMLDEMKVCFEVDDNLP